MVDTEKKLTVSFGNFSCTLSGFDDPFPVMRIVVDYFQELSQRDPSFGTKADYIDTEMLRALAERSDSLSANSQDDVAGIEINSNEPQGVQARLATLLATNSSSAPLFEEDETYVDIAAEDIDIAVRSRPAEKTEISDPDKPVSDEVGAESDVITNVESVEDSADTGVLPTWANELISDETLDESDASEENEDPEFNTATESKPDEEPSELLNADSEIKEIDADSPVSNLRDNFLSAQDEVSSEPTFDTNSEAKEPLNATQHFADDDLNRQTEPLRLGFGDVASLDATREVESATVDVRSKPDASDALEKMGLYSSSDDGADFNWDEIREAVPSAFEPKEASEQKDESVELNGSTAQSSDEENETTVGELPNSSAENPSTSYDLVSCDDIRQFAEASGAASLPELVEASAAFVTLVNGRPSFSRGEVLGLVDEFDKEEFSQKARIKSFGKLLRSGRIQRTENGDYAIARAALSHYENRIAS